MKNSVFLVCLLFLTKVKDVTWLLETLHELFPNPNTHPQILMKSVKEHELSNKLPVSAGRGSFLHLTAPSLGTSIIFQW